jgi:hypothetical protein
MKMQAQMMEGLYQESFSLSEDDKSSESSDDDTDSLEPLEGDEQGRE